MNRTRRWSRILVVVGFAAVVIGSLDPLEGSVLILPGIAVLAAEAWRSASRHRRVLFWSLALTAVGFSVMWGMTAMGGIGGRTGRSPWWALLLAPYPVGWIMGWVGGIKRVREVFRQQTA